MDTPDLSGPGLSFVHLYSQSLFPKIGEFELMMTASRPDVICVTETWLSSAIPDGLINIPDYTVIRNDRASRKRGGGTACYFKKSTFPAIDFSKHQKLWKSNSDIELQVFEFKVRNIKKLILLNVYRPPSGHAASFLDTLTDTLQSITHLDEYDLFILGDCNLPYNCKSSASFKRIKEFESRFGLTQLITQPTHYGSETANILDLIFTNSKFISRSGIWETTYSDHKPVFVVRKKIRHTVPKVNFQCRCFSSYSKDEFQQDLRNHNWGDFFEILSPESAWQALYNVICKTSDCHCPMRTYTSKNALPLWLSKEILEFIKQRDYVYKLAKQTSDPDEWARLRRLRNKCNRLVSRAKGDFVLSQLKDSEGDAKKFWRVINSIFSGNGDDSKQEINIIDPENGCEVPSNHCANFMNHFLTSAGPKLANALPHTPFRSTIEEFRSNLVFRRITVEETIKMIEGIDISKSSALDNLSSRLLKDAFLALPIHLTYIFNLSIDTAEFPESWKRSNVVLIPKEGVRDNPNNYRPISLLPLPGKLLEKLVHTRLYIPTITECPYGEAGGGVSTWLQYISHNHWVCHGYPPCTDPGKNDSSYFC